VIRKIPARELDIDAYFGRLRSNVVYAELCLMQLMSISAALVDRECMPDELRVNLEIQEQALKDMLILCISRLFDRKKSGCDQISLPNLEESRTVKLSEALSMRLKRLCSEKLIRQISDVRDRFVAHSLTHATDTQFSAKDAQTIIDQCYNFISDAYHFNRPSEILSRQDIGPYQNKWNEMVQGWQRELPRSDAT